MALFYDVLNLCEGLCRGRGICILDRLRVGNIHIHHCFDFRQGLAYACLISRICTFVVLLMSDLRQESKYCAIHKILAELHVEQLGPVRALVNFTGAKS